MKQFPERRLEKPTLRRGFLRCGGTIGRMLLAYIDEIGETGAFVARDHPKFKTSPAFGYAGFIIPRRPGSGVRCLLRGPEERLVP